MSRKFDNATRVDKYRFDPLDICIVGGKDLPWPEERGPKDKPIDPNSEFHVHDLLRPLDPVEVGDVFEHGVHTPIEGVMFEGVPHVLFGRGRVRKARLANIRRKKEGLPRILVEISFTRETKPLAIAKRIVSENLYRKELSVLDRIEMAVMLLNRGADEREVAAMFKIGPQRFKDWLALKDHATPKVREALQAGRLNASASIELALHAKDPEAMDKALETMLSAPSPPTARTARKAARAASGKDNPEQVTRRDIKRLHEIVRHDKKSHDLALIAETLEVVLGTRTKGRVYELLQDARKAKDKKGK